MGALRESLGPLFFRTLQMPLDPLTVFVPGMAALAQQCGLCRDRRRYVSPDRLASGLVLVLPGIEGPSLYAAGLRAGLADVPAAVRVVNWAGFWPGATAAMSSRFFCWRTARLIERIDRYRRDFPARPVVLVGHSGGAAVAIRAAELLGPAAPLAGVVALAPPLRPDYDFTVALAGVRCGIVTCHSHLDVQLRLLTLIGGNFDGRCLRTGGQCGFDCRDPRLTQIAWTAAMRSAGHWGGHIGWTAPPWVRQCLAPIVTDWLTEKVV